MVNLESCSLSMTCLKGIKLVTFDATNTLLQFRVPPWEYYALVAQNHGFTGTPADLKPRLLKSFKTSWKEHPNFGRDSIKWEQWWRQVVRNTLQDKLPVNANLEGIATTLIEDFTSQKCWNKTEGADELVNQLRASNINIGLISNFDPRLGDILHNVSMKNTFDFIVTSYAIGYIKPDRRIFQHALSLCNGVEPDQALHIGDDVEKDYHGAKAAGWNAVLIADNVQYETPPAKEHVFKSIKELTKAIKLGMLNL